VTLGKPLAGPGEAAYGLPGFTCSPPTVVTLITCSPPTVVTLKGSRRFLTGNNGPGRLSRPGNGGRRAGLLPRRGVMAAKRARLDRLRHEARC
jgi:hypothetical protein